MASGSRFDSAEAAEAARGHLRRNWGWFTALGIGLVLVGLFALGYPVVFTLVTVTVSGVALLVAGAFELAGCFWARRFGTLLQRALCGLFYVFLGVVIVDRPDLGAAGYTLVLAVFFFASGVVRIAYAVGSQLPGRGWSVLSGVVNLILGVMIWRNMPEAALWVIGTFVGIDLVFNGISWVMLGLAARSARAPAAPGETTALAGA
jgi:uncharacterized membrane protein HdeD (DUF308 family)